MACSTLPATPKHFFFPISTPDAGKNLIQQIQTFTTAHCPQTSTTTAPPYP